MSEMILLLEDDPSFGYILSEYLQLQGFEVDWLRSAEEVLEKIPSHSYRLAILDIMLPGMDGFELACRLQKERPNLPFIFLSARSLKVDQLKGFRLGAYDYITKPVDEELLVARIRALLGRITKPDSRRERYQIGKYNYLPDTFQLQFAGENRKLTAREAALLTLLCEHKEQLLPRRKALEEIWGSNDEFSRKSMDVFVSRLRKYLSADPSVRIENVHGQGFILHG